MADSTEYQRLIGDYPKLQNQEHREAFDKFLARMWTKPTTFKHYLRAYLEFITPEKPVFRRLNDLDNKRRQAKASSQKTRKSRRSGRRSRRSRRRRKKEAKQ